MTAPDIAGNEPFNFNVEIKNEGKIAIDVQLSVVSSQGSTIDNQQISIPSGETKQIQYAQQITNNTNFTFTFTGDINQTITKTVFFGLSTAITANPQAVYPEGRIGIPVTITNTGQLDDNLSVTYNLQPAASTQTKTYYIPEGGSIADTIYYDLTEGSYQFMVNSQLPIASCQTNFFVMKENKVWMTMSVGSQSDFIPLSVNLSNLGYNEINGSVQLSIVSPASGGSAGADSQATTVWNGSQSVSLTTNYQSPTPSPYLFNITPTAIEPGDYTLKAELLTSSNQQIAVTSQPLTIKGPVFQITQLPSYQTFTAGQEAEFTFKIKNTGNQAGAAVGSRNERRIPIAVSRPAASHHHHRGIRTWGKGPDQRAVNGR